MTGKNPTKERVRTKELRGELIENPSKSLKCYRWEKVFTMTKMQQGNDKPDNNVIKNLNEKIFNLQRNLNKLHQLFYPQKEIFIG